MTAAHAFLLLGGLEGVDGYVDSAGMLQLIPMLKAIGVETSLFTWNDYAKALPQLEALPAGCWRIVIGYSGGGSRATWLANMTTFKGPLHPRIDLMVLYDPSPSWQMEPIGSNVFKAICYHNTNPMMLGLGGGVLTKQKLAMASIETVDFAEQHLLVQFNQDLHRRTIEAVKQLLAMREAA